MGDRLTDAELVETLRVLRAHGTPTAAAKFLGVPRATFRERIALAEGRNLTADTPVLDEAAKLKIALKAAQRDIKALQVEHDTAESVRQRIYELASRSPAPPKWLDKPRTGASHPGVPMTIWSDWHFGEVVRPEEVAGMNEFNLEIAKRRVEKLVDVTVELCRKHMGGGDTAASYPGIVVMLGGDMMSGDIHEELFATNDRTTQQTINDLTDVLAAALERMADEFGKVFVPCVVGNHGRASRKPRMKGRVFTSHEWNVYVNLERHFRKDKRLQFFIPSETDAHFKVCGHRFLLTHGDSLGVKGGDGIIGAIGPIMRGSIKVGNSEAAIGRNVDTIVMGHWHQMLWLPGCIVNGALKGYDEYARLAMRAPYSRPSQGLWFVHPQHGITAKWEVFLEAKPTAEEAGQWLTWKDSNGG